MEIEYTIKRSDLDRAKYIAIGDVDGEYFIDCLSTDKDIESYMMDSTENVIVLKVI